MLNILIKDAYINFNDKGEVSSQVVGYSVYDANKVGECAYLCGIIFDTETKKFKFRDMKENAEYREFSVEEIKQLIAFFNDILKDSNKSAESEVKEAEPVVNTESNGAENA